MERVETVFSTFEEAMEVHKKLFEILRDKGVVYYRDYIGLIFPDDAFLLVGHEKNGWTSLNDMTIGLRPRGKWALMMPELELIEKEND